MSVKYIPVQWNKNKWRYNAVMLAGVAAFLVLFIYVTPDVLNHDRAITPQIHNARAFGACAFIMLTVILCIGPLARLDRRFLPLLYNRRHFGVMTTFVALTHAGYVMNWYFVFSATPKFEAVLAANTSFGQLAGFPIEALGLFALLCLLVLATTSHDFWLKFLTPPVWKRLHYLIYAAYVAIVAHVTLGVLQDQQNHLLTFIVIASAAGVAGTHLAAWRMDAAETRLQASDAWVTIGDVAQMREGYARIGLLPDGDRVAVFLMEGKLSAISNACAHQNGPLGEGKIIACLVTCPWHGFQYDVRSGRSPAPFTEMVPTYRVRVQDGAVQVHPDANPPGTHVDPVPLATTPEPEALT
ncbi:Rieske 2Fe-2S domain-containing protein [Ascidiaceihabitans sp.]|uniref:Rieske 2Fe-2S domain-containing protein n=1 Tax=Ascidiaceihabitans sp. TaxID=1872644 RepID=UPI003299A592